MPGNAYLQVQHEQSSTSLKDTIMSDMTISPVVRNGRFAALFRSLAERVARYRL